MDEHMNERQAILALREPLIHLMKIVNSSAQLKGGFSALLEMSDKALADTKEYDGEAHDLFVTSDIDRPEEICDRNGEVVLSLCRKCGKAENDLTMYCTPKGKSEPDAKESAPIDPATPANILVNDGVLCLALNALRRAGKNEIADEVEKTIQSLPTKNL